MKKLVAALLVAFTVSTASVSFAATPKTLDQATTGPAASVTFAQVEKSKLDVVVENPAHAKMTIYLTDTSGKSFAAKTLSGRETDTRVRFDLARLAGGVYHVKVWDGRKTEERKFQIKTTEVSVATDQTLALL
jgi:hypothetical protein